MPRYLRPPVFERVMSIYAPMTPEKYEGRFESWRDLVQQEFPLYEPVKIWRINVRQKEGIPLYDTREPQLEITPRFAKKPEKEGFDRTLRCPSGQLTINLHSKPADGRGYPLLRTMVTKWLPRWMDHFEVAKVDRILMQYVNFVTPETIPAFTMRDGGLDIARVLRVFVQIPGVQQCIIPPCDCSANVLLVGRNDATMLIHLLSDISRKGLRLDFVVNANVQPDESTADLLFGVMDWAHRQILDRFEVVFTDEAKKNFQPTDEPSPFT